MKYKNVTVGDQMHSFIKELYPLPRSLTGAGVRQTLEAIQSHIPLKFYRVKSGTQVYDWTVPDEWNIRDAYIKDSSGRKVVDFKNHTLHVVSYSRPVKKTLTLTELKPHLFSLPDYPDAIPFRTAYYDNTWGFCMKYADLQKLKDGTYEVVIDADLKPGHLTYGELYISGKIKDEILVSTHICHPSLANDNLSGIAVTTWLASSIMRQKPYYSYRFVYVPATIGSITWLWRNEASLSHIRHGLVVTGVGDLAKLTYKKSRQGDADIDAAFTSVLKSLPGARAIDFYPFGYDERQYSSPGFNLPVGTLMRSLHGNYPEYHTSRDNLAFVHPSSLAQAYEVCLKAFSILEKSKTYINLSPNGEPRLGKRGLYRVMNIQDSQRKEFQLALLWVLNQSDARHSLFTISQKSNLPITLISRAADLLTKHHLLKERK